MLLKPKSWGFPTSSMNFRPYNAGNIDLLKGKVSHYTFIEIGLKCPDFTI